MEKTKTWYELIALDAALVMVACMIPVVSHLVGWPIYKLNPMLAIVLAGMFVGRDWRNSLALAVVLPLLSCAMVGMPSIGKAVCMAAELCTVAGVYAWIGRRWATLPAVLMAIVMGKIVYYALKMVVVAPVVLVGTDWKVQALAVLLWGGLFAIADKAQRR